jgi:hypothetical protein
VVARYVDSPVEVISMLWPLLIVVMTVIYDWIEVDTSADDLTTGVVIDVFDGEGVDEGVLFGADV